MGKQKDCNGRVEMMLGEKDRSIVHMVFHSGIGLDNYSEKGLLFEFQFGSSAKILFTDYTHAKYYYSGFCASNTTWKSIALWQINPGLELISLHTLKKD